LREQNAQHVANADNEWTRTVQLHCGYSIRLGAFIELRGVYKRLTTASGGSYTA